MRFSAVICTWNRCDLLRQTLEQMTKLRLPGGAAWELLVVNNNSTDATEAACGAYKDRLPLRYFFEPKPGKSNALNLVLKEARGAYLLYTDDDVLVAEDWIAEYDAAFQRHPDAAIFGGAIDPWFEGEPPEWLPRVMPIVESAYAVRRMPPESPESEMKANFLPFGANLAIRAEEQRRFPYDPKLGPNANTQMRGEETAVLLQMLEAGVKGLWAPRARVRHFLPKARQSEAFLRGVYRGLGILSGRRMHERGEAGAGARLGLRWQRFSGNAKYALGKVLGSPETWVKGLRHASTAEGRIAGLDEAAS
ncbi:MAG: glycosyltransferase family 2 protein [Planctomycetota bacterium]|nr:glycosyltransferase family 2 protein [Planctomycetota bacterium]